MAFNTIYSLLITFWYSPKCCSFDSDFYFNRQPTVSPLWCWRGMSVHNVPIDWVSWWLDGAHTWQSTSIAWPGHQNFGLLWWSGKFGKYCNINRLNKWVSPTRRWFYQWKWQCSKSWSHSQNSLCSQISIRRGCACGMLDGGCLLLFTIT